MAIKRQYLRSILEGAYKVRFFESHFETWILAQKIGSQATVVRPPQPPTGGSRGQDSDFTRPQAPMSADFTAPPPLCSPAPLLPYAPVLLHPRSPAPLPPRSPAPPHPRFLTAQRLFRTHPGLLIALLVYLILAFSYFFITPIFEGPDEWTHTGHVAYIAQENGLPVMLPGQGIWGGQQPPLYFALGALLVRPFETGGVNEYAETAKNPHRSLGYALDPGNKNNYLHTPAENFPYRGLSLTVHILRLYSIAFGLVALIFTYLTAYDLFIHYAPRPNHQSTTNNQLLITNYQLPITLLPAAVAFLVACQPMFAFITALVANEPANMAFSAAGLWLAQRYVLYGPTPHWKRAVCLGVVLGLISLSKMTGLSFGLVAVVAMLQTAIATRKQPGAARLLWRDGLMIGLLALAGGGWWYWRNYQLYGDFFQEGLYKIYFGVDPQPLTLDDFLYTLSTGEVSFWATFGWLNIVAPEWVYSVYRIISRIGLLGVGLAAAVQLAQRIGINKSSKPSSITILPPNTKRRPKTTQYAIRNTQYVPPSPLLIHFTFPITLAFSLTRLVAIEGGLQGRQLLPALGSIAIIIVWGWGFLTPPRLQRPVLAMLGGLLLGIAIWLPYGVVGPNYIPKPLLTEVELPADLLRLDWTYNDEMKLIGVDIEAKSVKPGQRAPVTAYWQALKPMETNYSVFVHLIGRNYQNVGQFNTYPGLGLRPTSRLKPGQIVKDTYPVLVNGGSEAPARLLVNIGLFDINEPGRPGIQPVAPDGGRPPPTTGQLKLVPHTWPDYQAKPPLAAFGDRIELIDVARQNCRGRANDCQITFTWLAKGQPATDYTVFIQLWPGRPPDGARQFFGFDGPPLDNDYPTSLWEAGEVIIDPHRLDLSALSPGEYHLLSGLYNLTTGGRVPATSEGEPLEGFAVDLGTIRVE